MELGISPIVTASMIIQLLTSTGIIFVDKTNRDDIMRQESLMKLFSIMLIVLESVGLVVGGQYGTLQDLHYNAILIASQLIIASMITLLLDEVMDKHGLGHGISVFIAINIAESIMWQIFSPITIAGNDNEASFEGIFINLVHKLLTEDTQAALNDAFFRDRGENIMNLLATIFIIMIVMYLEGWYTSVSLSRKDNPQDGFA